MCAVSTRVGDRHAAPVLVTHSSTTSLLSFVEHPLSRGNFIPEPHARPRRFLPNRSPEDKIP